MWCFLKHKWASLGIIPEINLQLVRCRLIDLDPLNNKPWSAELLNNNNNDGTKKKQPHLIYEKPFVQLLSTDQKELKHTHSISYFVFIILCASQLLEEIQINIDSQENHGINRRRAEFWALTSDTPILSLRQFSQN